MKASSRIHMYCLLELRCGNALANQRCVSRENRALEALCNAPQAVAKTQYLPLFAYGAQGCERLGVQRYFCHCCCYYQMHHPLHKAQSAMQPPVCRHLYHNHCPWHKPVILTLPLFTPPQPCDKEKRRAFRAASSCHHIAWFDCTGFFTIAAKVCNTATTMSGSVEAKNDDTCCKHTTTNICLSSKSCKHMLHPHKETQMVSNATANEGG